MPEGNISSPLGEKLPEIEYLEFSGGEMKKMETARIEALRRMAMSQDVAIITAQQKKEQPVTPLQVFEEFLKDRRQGFDDQSFPPAWDTIRRMMGVLVNAAHEEIVQKEVSLEAARARAAVLTRYGRKSGTPLKGMEIMLERKKKEFAYLMDCLRLVDETKPSAGYDPPKPKLNSLHPHDPTMEKLRDRKINLPTDLEADFKRDQETVGIFREMFGSPEGDPPPSKHVHIDMSGLKAMDFIASINYAHPRSEECVVDKPVMVQAKRSLDDIIDQNKG